MGLKIPVSKFIYLQDKKTKPQFLKLKFIKNKTFSLNTSKQKIWKF